MKKAPVLKCYQHVEGALLHKERQREGIERARREGKYQGRKPKLTDNEKAALLARIAAGENKSALAREYGIDRVTIHRIAKSAGMLADERT